VSVLCWKQVLCTGGIAELGGRALWIDGLMLRVSDMWDKVSS
jgi:hypothetical protein